MWTKRAAHEQSARRTMDTPRGVALMQPPRRPHEAPERRGDLAGDSGEADGLLTCGTMQYALGVSMWSRWVHTVQIGPSADVNAINSNVAWGERRDHLRLSMVDAVVVGDLENQPAGLVDAPGVCMEIRNHVVR